ncbi:ribosome maturation factor RimM [Marinicrinis sediminis]|uniref:Ribosome maturation factor RimM n=1 Tax=Marinicrinis sediminis TaxID=1652465 RepID=A0ABW5R7S5_9BACL
MEEKLYQVAKIVNTHGIRGELKVISTTDFEEERFAKGSQLWLSHPNESKPIPWTVKSARPHKGSYIILFDGFTNINEVEKYKGGTLNITEQQFVPLEENEYYVHEIVGCEVITDEGVHLGKIRDVLTTGANDVWIVKGEKGKEILIPYIKDVVLEVDIEAKKIRIHLLEGLV